jgi:cephalosporin hydroxylase
MSEPSISRIRDDEFAVSPNRLHIGHTNAEVAYLMDVIESEKPRGFIEVGVHVGGLADVLIPKVENYLGLEINSGVVDSSLQHRIASNPNASFWFGDAWQAEALVHCAKWMQRKSPVFIYCDGGDKTLELNLYSECARAGDLIGVHDYGVYEGAEIEPEYADNLMEERNFMKYRPSFRPKLIRIEIWRG